MSSVSITIQNAHRNALHGAIGTKGEVDLIDEVYYKLAPILIANGVVVYYEDDGLWDTQGNFIGLLNGDKDYFLSLHFDGSVNKNVSGGFVDAGEMPSNTKEKDWKFAQTIADYYFGPMGIVFRGNAGRTDNTRYYYAFYATGDNTVQALIELATLTNDADFAKCQDTGKIARLLAEGILAYLKANDPRYQGPATLPSPGGNQAEIDGLRQQLEAQKVAQDKLAGDYTKCQQTCQSLLERLNNIKDYVAKT